MSTYAKPLPRPSEITRPFWEAARKGKIIVQRCEVCGRAQHPPRPTCSNCWSDNIKWIECSGDGEVYTYTVCHWATMPSFKNETPYIVAIVELPEGIRLNGGVIKCSLEQIRIGLKVKASFSTVTDDVTLVNFEPA